MERKVKPLEEQVKETFGADSFRKYQKPTTRMLVEDLRNNINVAVLSAPTGFGKSLVLETVGQLNGPTFYATPLNSLVDQLVNDENIGHRVYEMKGMNNYRCIRDDVDSGTTVEEAPCQTETGFNCDHKNDDCEYYGRKLKLNDEDIIVTNLSFLMAESQIPENLYKFDDRTTLIVDECQRVESYATNFATIELSEDNLPQTVWTRISIPDYDEYDKDSWREWVEETLTNVILDRMEELENTENLTFSQRAEYDKLSDLSWRLNTFTQDAENNAWVADQEEIEQQRGPDYTKVELQPVVIGRFLKNNLWSRADNIILSSATIPGDSTNSDGHKWLNEIGIYGDSKSYSVPHTFPVRNRPIYVGDAVGKMTKDEREDTIPDMADKIKELADGQHSGEPGIIHCRSYDIANALYDELPDIYADTNVELQGSYDREGSLQRWLNDDTTQLFFSVNMSEGIDLEGDTCRWQAVAKTLYPHMGDARVRYRVEEWNDWAWYNQKAAIQLQQAYGRAVRGPNDEATMHILDKSAVGLIRRDAELFQEWFLEAIQDLHIDEKRGI